MQFVFLLIQSVFQFSASQFQSGGQCHKLEPGIIKAEISLLFGIELYSLAVNEAGVVEPTCPSLGKHQTDAYHGTQFDPEEEY